MREVIDISENSRLYEMTKRICPGGVQDGLRYLEPPLYFDRANGSKVWDVEGKEYIDFHLAFGPILLGHCHPKVTEAVKEQASSGDIFGLGGCELEYKVAQRLVTHIPSASAVRFCVTGTEATYHAIRLARAFTGKKKILKFEGCYHGWHDYLDVSVYPPLDQMGAVYPQSAGMLEDAFKNTLISPFNDLEAFERRVKEAKNELAAVIVEPIAHNIGCVLPRDEFLKGMREITERYGIVLIFDEVITCFRHSLGGVQGLFGIKPDLTTLAKSIANGYPLAAVVGREDIMDLVGPAGKVFMGGTFTAHPVSLAASLATIRELESGEVHEYLFSLGKSIRGKLSELIGDLEIRAQVSGFGSIFKIYFIEPKEKIENYGSLLSNDLKANARFVSGMREKGILIHPHHLKRYHLCAAHTKEDAARFVDAASQVLQLSKDKYR